jgi:hypothetical protein
VNIENKVTADLDPPLVPDRYLKRLRELPVGTLAGVVWSLASKLSDYEDEADIIAEEIKAIQHFHDLAAADREVDEQLQAAA